MTLSAIILAAALAHGNAHFDSTAAAHHAAAPRCVTAERTGTFRVSTRQVGRNDVGLGLLILEDINGCLEATYISDNASAAAIDGLSMSDNTLRGALSLPTGSAKLELQFVGKDVEGSIVQGRNQWSVEGRKTS
jgi:hypothetical protein